MKARIPDGYAVVFFETDSTHKKPVERERLDSQQRKWLARLDRDKQARILQGEPARIVQLADGGFLCEFNMRNVAPDIAMLGVLAGTLYPSILEFYESTENIAEFEKWQNKK